MWLWFPGGNLELKESFVDSVIREIKEETELDIFNLELCGVKQWFNEKKEEMSASYIKQIIILVSLILLMKVRTFG
ncbi:NUDIX domain-containing protein [Metamycoplasma hominis]|uniref:NUDIX domain-containing protein n=1 Tax=Metamycoplasma hominis TaxID=2098 RepID=UPI003CE71180